MKWQKLLKTAATVGKRSILMLFMDSAISSNRYFPFELWFHTLAPPMIIVNFSKLIEWQVQIAEIQITLTV